MTFRFFAGGHFFYKHRLRRDCISEEFHYNEIETPIITRSIIAGAFAGVTHI